MSDLVERLRANHEYPPHEEIRGGSLFVEVYPDDASRWIEQLRGLCVEAAAALSEQAQTIADLVEAATTLSQTWSTSHARGQNLFLDRLADMDDVLARLTEPEGEQR